MCPVPAAAAVPSARPASAGPAFVSLLHAADHPTSGIKNLRVSRALPPAGGGLGDVFASGECASDTANAVLRLREDAVPLCGSCGGGEFASGGAVEGWTTSSAEAVYVFIPCAGEPERVEGAGNSQLKFQSVLDFATDKADCLNLRQKQRCPFGFASDNGANSVAGSGLRIDLGLTTLRYT